MQQQHQQQEPSPSQQQPPAKRRRVGGVQTSTAASRPSMPPPPFPQPYITWLNANYGPTAQYVHPVFFPPPPPPLQGRAQSQPVHLPMLLSPHPPPHAQARAQSQPPAVLATRPPQSTARPETLPAAPPSSTCPAQQPRPATPREQPSSASDSAERALPLDSPVLRSEPLVVASGSVHPATASRSSAPTTPSKSPPCDETALYRDLFGDGEDDHTLDNGASLLGDGLGLPNTFSWADLDPQSFLPLLNEYFGSSDPPNDMNAHTSA